jgi:glycosyltransferase involved in cell wall biosynthesis
MTEAVGVKQVSVCLLTYNHAHLVESTIRSILAQSLTDFELIISDDCSTDATWAHVLALAATDSRIKPLRTAHPSSTRSSDFRLQIDPPPQSNQQLTSRIHEFLVVARFAFKGVGIVSNFWLHWRHVRQAHSLGVAPLRAVGGVLP